METVKPSKLYPSKVYKRCGFCGGDGYFPFSASGVCDFCGGTGEIEIKDELQERNSNMTNYSRAILLFNENIRVVNICYEPDTDRVKQTRYPYKTLDQTIQKDDYVVIPTDTRHGFTVVRVDAVDVEVELESGVDLKWIVDKVDMPLYNKVLSEEGKWISTLKASEARKKREDMKKNLTEFVKAGEIEALAITHMTSPDTTPAPTSAPEDKTGT